MRKNNNKKSGVTTIMFNTQGSTRIRVLRSAITALMLLSVMAFSRQALAVPSFASQTGMPCSQCHVVSFGVALTAYGRQFKLNGYTFSGGDQPMP